MAIGSEGKENNAANARTNFQKGEIPVFKCLSTIWQWSKESFDLFVGVFDKRSLSVNWLKKS